MALSDRKTNLLDVLPKKLAIFSVASYVFACACLLAFFVLLTLGHSDQKQVMILPFVPFCIFLGLPLLIVPGYLLISNIRRNLSSDDGPYLMLAKGGITSHSYLFAQLMNFTMLAIGAFIGAMGLALLVTSLDLWGFDVGTYKAIADDFFNMFDNNAVE